MSALAVDEEWEPDPGNGARGRADLVFSDTHGCEFAVVEAKVRLLMSQTCAATICHHDVAPRHMRHVAIQRAVNPKGCPN